MELPNDAATHHDDVEGSISHEEEIAARGWPV